MKQDRPNTQVLLIDIQYFDSTNAFEYWYGDSITYQEIEQRSYIELKDLLFEKISHDIKFRKHGRIGQVLTLKVDMLKEETDIFFELLRNKEISLIHRWIISRITIIKDNQFDSKSINEEFEEEQDGFESEE